MTTSDWIATFAVLVSFVALADSRRASRFAKRQYAAERREETLASAKVLHEVIGLRIRELELLLSDVEFRAPAETIVQINRMIEPTKEARSSLERTIAKMQDDRSLDLNDVVTWFNMRREIREIEIDDKQLTESIRVFRSGIPQRKTRQADNIG